MRHRRRSVLKALAPTTVTALAAPGIVRADAATTLRYDPGVLDPHRSTSGSTCTPPTAVTYASLRGNSTEGWAGWPDSPKLEAPRRKWIDTPDPAEQKRIAVEMQLQCWIDVPYVPLGQNMQPSAYRSELVDILPGFSTFWNVRRS